MTTIRFKGDRRLRSSLEAAQEAFMVNRALKITGRSQRRLIGTHDFFVLAAGAGWTGQISIKLQTGRGYRWEMVYRGPWVQQYADLLFNNNWPERIQVVDDEE